MKVELWFSGHSSPLSVLFEVVDTRPIGGGDEDYEVIPTHHSVHCEIGGAPHRLICHPPLHCEFRTRNVIMNEVSAASGGVFQGVLRSPPCV